MAKKEKKEKKDEDEDLKAKKKAKKEKKAKAAEEEADAPESPKKVKKDKSEKKKKRKAEEAGAEEETSKEEKKAKKAKKNKDEKKKKKKKAEEEEEEEEVAQEETAEEEAAEAEEEEEAPAMKVHKKGGAPDNPTGTCEVFMGNLSFSIDDEKLQEAFKECGKVVSTKWLEHRDTGRFKGAGFITFETPEAAAKAVAMDGQDVLGRPVKSNFSNGKPNAAAGGKGGAREVRPMQPKPEGCTTLFCGNLSWDVNDDTMREFFQDCGEVRQIRWLTDKETQQFKGCGFVEFADPDTALDLAAKKNGETFLGRQIRLDYAAPRG